MAKIISSYGTWRRHSKAFILVGGEWKEVLNSHIIKEGAWVSSDIKGTHSLAQAYFDELESTYGVTLSASEKHNWSEFCHRLENRDLEFSRDLLALLHDAISLRSAQNIGTGTTALSLKKDVFTITNAPTWGTTGMTFVRASNSLVKSSNSWFADSSTFTSFGVFKPENISQSQVVYGQYNRATPSGWAFLQWGSTNNRIIYFGTTGSFPTDTIVDDYHVCVTSHNSNVFRLALPQVGTAVNVTGNSSDADGAGNGFAIGGTVNSDPLRAFQGVFCAAFGFTAQLTDEEMSKVYNVYANTIGRSLDLSDEVPIGGYNDSVSYDPEFSGGTYESSSYDSVNGILTLNPGTYHTYYDSYGAHITGLLGTSTKIHITQADNFGASSSLLGAWRGVWATSPDTDEWNAFDITSYRAGGTGKYIFGMNGAWTVDEIYFRPIYGFSVARAQNNVTSWLANENVNPVSSANSSGVISMTTATTNPFGGSTIPSLPRLGVKIGSGEKHIILTASIHPTEQPGPYELEGMVNFLLGGGEIATRLLSTCTFYVYPCISVRSVYAGLTRMDFDTLTDANRMWDGSDGPSADIDAFKTAMVADTGGVVHGWIDCHSSPNASTGGRRLVWMDSAHVKLTVNTAWRNALNTYTVADGMVLDTTEFTLLAGAAIGWGSATFADMIMGVLLEFTHSKLDNPTTWRAHGANAMKALDDVIQGALL